MQGSCDRNNYKHWEWGLLDFPGKNVTKVYSSMLLALRGGGWVSIFQEKSVRNVHLNGRQRRGGWESVRIRVTNMYGST